MSDPYETPLSRFEEGEYQKWKQRFAPNDSGFDYDYRGAFKAGVMPDPETGAWPDKFKKPNNPTYSDASQYRAPAKPVQAPATPAPPSAGAALAQGKADAAHADRAPGAAGAALAEGKAQAQAAEEPFKRFEQEYPDLIGIDPDEYELVKQHALAANPDNPEDELYKWGTAYAFSKIIPGTHPEDLIGQVDKLSEWYTGKSSVPKSNYRAVADAWRLGLAMEKYNLLGDDLGNLEAELEDALTSGDHEKYYALTPQIEKIKRDMDEHYQFMGQLEDAFPRPLAVDLLKGAATSGPFTLKAVIAGAAAGAVTGGLGAGAELTGLAAKIASSAATYKEIAGASYLALRESGVNARLARDLSSFLDAPLQSAIETSLGETAGYLGRFAGTGNLTAKVMKRLVTQGTMGGLGAAAVQYASGVAGEGFEEALQSLSTDTAKAIASVLQDGGVDVPTATEAAASAAQAAVQGWKGAIILGAPGLMIDMRRQAETAKTATATKEALAREEQPAAPGAPAAPIDAKAFAERAKAPLPEGTVIQSREEIEGEQYILKAGNKDSGERLGSLRYELDPEAQTARILGFEKAEPNVQAFLVRGLSARLPGWSIEMEAKGSSQAALRDLLVQQNPRGPEAGLSYYEAPAAAVDRVTEEYVRSRILEFRPTWKPDEADLAVKILPAWARRMGMTGSELADAALSRGVFGQILDKSAAAQAEGKVPAGVFVRVQEGGLFRGLIDMAPRANPSTAMHEMTHAVVNFARQAREDPKIGQFLQELEGALGVQDGNWEAEFAGWTDEYGPARDKEKYRRERPQALSYLEAVTYAMEDYLVTGKAPKPELEGLFRKLAQWIRDIYEGMKGARVNMSPEMTAYFDELFGGEGSPFLEPKAGHSEESLALRAREIDQAPADALEAQEGAPAAARTERRGIAGARRDLESAKARLAAGEDAETVARETGWREQNGEWRQDEGFTSAPEYEQHETERELQEGVLAEVQPDGPATFTRKAYPEEDQAVEPIPGEDDQLYQGDNWGDALETRRGAGQEAIEKLLKEEKGHARDVFFKEGLGWIDVPWGEPGDMDNDYAGGWGLSHIKAKHEFEDQVIGKLGEIIEKGQITPDTKPDRRRIKWLPYTVVVQFEREDGTRRPWIKTALIRNADRRSAPAVGSGNTGDVTTYVSPNAPKGGAAERTPPAGKRVVIVRRKPGPGKSLDQNDIKPAGGGELFQGDRGVETVVYSFPSDLVGYSDIHSQAQLPASMNVFGRGVVAGDEIRLGNAGSTHAGLASGLTDAKRFYFGYSRQKKAVYVVAKNGMDQEALQKPAVLQRILSQIFDQYRLSTGGQRLKFADALFQGETEEIGDLVAVHNIDARKLTFADKLGGLAMPSLAVINRKIPFESFGDITLIAPKSRIDPEANPGVKVFNADIYSPRYPDLTYKFDEKKLMPIAEKIAEALAPLYDKSKDDYIRRRKPSKYVVVEQLKEAMSKSGVSALKWDQNTLAYWRLAIDGQKGPIERLTARDAPETPEIKRFEAWAEETFSPLLDNPQIFKGFTNAGNRRYSPYTLENVLAEMKKASLQGGEGFTYGLPSIRAVVAKQYKSLEAMRRDKAKILSDEDFESAKETTDRLFNDILDEAGKAYGLKESAFSAASTFVENLLEGIRRNNIRGEMEAYNFKGLTDETYEKINLLLQALREMPTEYFEAKIKGTLSLESFYGAVIPKSTDRATRAILERHGIRIEEYKDRDKADRADAITRLAMAVGPGDILFQGEGEGEDLADSQTRAAQGDGQDEAGISTLKDLARGFDTWEEFAEFIETPFGHSEGEPQDMAPAERQAWYKALWQAAREVHPIDLEDWTRRLEADNYSELVDFLEGIWNEILLPSSMRDLTAEDMEGVDRMREMKDELAETIVAGAQRVGTGRRDFDPRFLRSLAGTIRKNPEEYARIYGEVMAQPEIAKLGAAREREKYADIKDPKIQERMSISQRAALASQIRDEKLASDVLSGRVAMAPEAKEYLGKLRTDQKAARKKIADLEAEAKAAEATLSVSERRLAAARAEAARTGQEITRTKKRIDRFLSRGQKVPRGFESKLKTQEARAKALRAALQRAGDFEALTAQSRALDARLERIATAEATPELLALRSHLQAERRALEPKLRAAGEKWKDMPGLQTYLVKAEALAKAQEKYQTRDAELRARKKLRAYQERLVRQIMGKVSDTLAVDEQKAILALQQMLDPAFRAERTQEQIDLLRTELEANPELAREIPKEWLRRATARNLNEMSLAELEEMAGKVQELRRVGRAKKKARDAARRAQAERKAAEIEDVIRRTPGYRAPTGFEPEKKLIDRLRDKIQSADYAFLSMRRMANKLDGGKDGANVELLWHEMNRHYREEMIGIDRRTAAVLHAFKDAGIRPEDWYSKTVTVEGAGPGGAAKVLRKSDLLALEMAFRNEDSRAAALFGCFFSEEERKAHGPKKQGGDGDLDWFDAQGATRFEALRKAIDSVLTPQDEQVLAALSADSSAAGARLAEVVAAVENRIFVSVEDYFPLMRQGVTQEPTDVQIAGDMQDRTPGLRRPPKNGMTKARTTVPPWGQTAIKLDLLTTWLSSIQSQEHYLATAEYAKRLDAVYTNELMRETIRGMLGDAGVDYFKEYITEVKNPGSERNRSRWDRSLRYLRGNLGFAYLAFRASSTLKQIVTSPWPTVPYAGPRMLSETFRCLANPPKFLRETEAMSEVLKHRTRDLIFQAVREATASSKAGKAALAAEKIGMKGLELADRFSVAIGWRACYEKALVEFKGDHEKAVEKADDIILKTQPASRGVDLAPIYREGGEFKKLVLQFTQAMNVIWQNLRYDLPNAVKNHQFTTAVGIAASYAIAGALLNALTSEPPEGEDDEARARRLAFWSITQGTDSIPLIGQYVTRAARTAITGEKAPTYPNSPIPGIEEVITGISQITQEQYEKGLANFARGAGTIMGLPVSGVKEAIRAAGGDLGSLVGRPKQD